MKMHTDVYMSTGYSAYDTICWIRALLKKYDIDSDEFVYSARANNPGKTEE